MIAKPEYAGRFSGLRGWRESACAVYRAIRSTPSTASMRDTIASSNINKETLLATDYLNHFNEIAMLIQLLPDMPEAIDDVMAWKPKCYKEHFRDSTFSDRELAVRAYDCVPSAYLLAFEDSVAAVNTLISKSIPRLVHALKFGDRTFVGEAAASLSRQIDELMAQMRCIINGELKTLGQGEIDDILLEYPDAGEPGEEMETERSPAVPLSQSAIDSLFD